MQASRAAWRVIAGGGRRGTRAFSVFESVPHPVPMPASPTSGTGWGTRVPQRDRVRLCASVLQTNELGQTGFEPVLAGF